jgi:hypothetical protein
MGTLAPSVGRWPVTQAVSTKSAPVRAATRRRTVGDSNLGLVIRLDAATVLLQWAAGILAFLWVTTRHREVGLGYGWLMRGIGAALGIGAFVAGVAGTTVWGREIASMAMVAATLTALAVSVARKAAGVSGRRVEHDRRTARVAAMTGIERDGSSVDLVDEGREFPATLDLLAPAIGLVGLVVAGASVEAHVPVAIVRTVVGAAFLGAVTDAMLLGHWYLVQPGLPRRLLNELVTWVGLVWPAEVVAMLLPTGMLSVLSGAVDDGWNGTLGWFWVASAVTTIVLVLVTRAALREREYSAVMAATGLLYLALLTAFSTDLVARAVLAG